MALVTDDALTLAVSDYSETSQVVTLFTRLNGRLSVLAKGSKRPKNRFGGPVDRLQAVQAVFSVRPSGGLGQLTELCEQDAFAGLRTDLRSFYAASYVAELVRATTEELDPHPEVFKMVIDALRRLSRGDKSDILLYRFEVRLLGALGLMPQWGTCVSCRRPRPAGPGGQPGRASFFSPAAGGVVCRRCRARTGDGDGLDVSGKALDALAFLAEADDEKTERVRLSAETAADMRKLLRACWVHVLGREPRSLRWVP